MFIIINNLLICLLWSSSIIFSNCDSQVDPDPWNLVTDGGFNVNNNKEVPPDLRPAVSKKKLPSENLGNGEWFFRRMLAVVLKGGRIEINEDGSVEVALQMRFDVKKWKTLDDYTKSNSALTEEMFRRSIGYVEEAIYKPTISEKIAMAWSDHVQIYLTEYKAHITWTFSILSAVTVLWKLWNNMSHKHLIMIIIILCYVYEVFVSYKEAEQQELVKFISAINKCKWYFWTSTCDTPTPDPITFLKHMNPLKIAVRMFSTLISEPMIVINDNMKVMVLSITDGLWFPFDKILYGFLILVFNVLILLTLIMIVFNFLLNIPFNLNFLGLISFGVKQRARSIFTNKNNESSREYNDRIGGANLDRLLDICSRAINNAQNVAVRGPDTSTSAVTLKKSASTGRLNEMSNSSFNNNTLALKNNARRRTPREEGSGDAS